MIGRIVQFADLQELCQPGRKPRRPTVEAWARRCGVRVNYDGQGGVWTTLDALNAALGLGPANDGGAELKPDQVL